MASAGDGSVVLEEEIDPNYNPTEDEVIEYAKWLGMDIEEDKDLLWIAREGLKVGNARSPRGTCGSHHAPRDAGPTSRQLEAMQDERHERDLLLQLRHRREHMGPSL